MTNLADLIIALAGIIFTVGLLPTVWHQWKVRQSTVPWSTSLVTALALVCLVVAYATLQLWLALITISANLFLWLIIAVQRWGYTKTHVLVESRAARRRRHKADWKRGQKRRELTREEMHDATR
jgi:small-conductance mechanosensitive channel